MSKKRYDKHDIEELLGLTSRQLRTRLSHLDGTITQHIYEGKRGATLVDDAGFFILKRMMELEDDGCSIEDAAEIVEEELESQEAETKGEDVRESQAVGELVEQLKSRIKELEEDKHFLQKEIDRLHYKVDRLLPGETVEQQGFLKKVWSKVW